MKASHLFCRLVATAEVLIALLLSAVGAVHADSAQAQANEYKPVYHPSLEITKAAGKIKVDGHLGDPGWRDAAVASHFAEHFPGDQTKPPVDTKAYITYDDDNLYVAFVCYDDPSLVRASHSQREEISNDDNVVLLLDTYGDAAWAYELYVNPYGVQADGLWTPSIGEDRGFDLIWESAGMITDSGYQVEMAVPFSALRFPNKQEQTWKVDFYRNHPRESSREYSWAAYDRNEQCWACQWGTVTGIRDVSPGKGIELIGAWVGQQSGNLRQRAVATTETTDFRTGTYDYDIDNADALGELSFGGKYSLSSDITVEATYNPDFSQIEADAGQIDVNTTFALFYPERRPFFQEGSDIFRTLFNSFYSRTINDPVFAAKVTARGSRSGFGYLVARDENSPLTLPFEEFSDYLLAGKSTVNIVRARQALGNGAHIGGLITRRDFDEGGSGTVLAADGRIRFTPTLLFDYQLVATHTQEADNPEFTRSPRFDYLHNVYFTDDSLTAAFDGESYWGEGGLAIMRWNTRTWNATANYWEVSKAYRADNGFDPKINRRDLTLSLGYRHRPTNSVFAMVNPWTEAGTVWNFDGERKSRFVHLNLINQLNVAQLFFQTQYGWSEETLNSFDSTTYSGLWHIYQEMYSRLSDWLDFDASVIYGHRLAWRYGMKASMLELEFSTGIKPHSRILLAQSIHFTKANALDDDTELFNTYIARTQLNYQVSRPLTFRLIAEYDEDSSSWLIDPLITYRINSFSVLYIGSSAYYSGNWPERYQEVYDPGSDTWSTREWGSATKLTSRQFFMKLQYLWQI